MIPGDVFRDQPVLTGSRARLEPLTTAVLDDHWASLRDPEGLRLTGTHAAFTRDQVVAYLESRPRQHDHDDGGRHDAVLMSVLRTDPRPTGT